MLSFCVFSIHQQAMTLLQIRYVIWSEEGLYLHNCCCCCCCCWTS